MTSSYEGLPICRAAMDGAEKDDAAGPRFPKGHKYTLGSRTCDTAADPVLLVARAGACNVKRRTLAYLYEPVGLGQLPSVEPSRKDSRL